MTRHYEKLTAPERFILLVEAMARRDDVEADRLEDSCPRLVYRTEDAEFRDRMRRAYSIAATVCLNMRQGLAAIRMADALRHVARQFADAPTRVAEVAFLYARAYGHWEAGKIKAVELPDRESLRAEIAANADLKQQLDELREIVGESIDQLAQGIHTAVGEAYAADLLSQWEGFARFCRDMLGVEPVTLALAFGVIERDLAAEVRAAYPDAVADEAEIVRRAAGWTRSWGRRFAERR